MLCNSDLLQSRHSMHAYCIPLSPITEDSDTTWGGVKGWGVRTTRFGFDSAVCIFIKI